MPTIQRVLKGPLPWCLSLNRLPVIQVALPPPWLRQTKPAVADPVAADPVAAEVAEAVLDEARGAAVANRERNCAEQINAIDAAVDVTSTEIASMIQIAMEKKL